MLDVFQVCFILNIVMAFINPTATTVVCVYRFIFRLLFLIFQYCYLNVLTVCTLLFILQVPIVLVGDSHDGVSADDNNGNQIF